MEAFSPTPMLLAMRRFPEGTEGQAYWVHLDGRGSVAGLTKHQGQSTHNYRYEAYGQLLPAQGNWTDPHNHYTFLGKEWDEHLGLYAFGVRLYDPWAGVWLTREPLAGNLREPRTWHRYAYAFASPISYDDPYGLQTCGFNILTGERECFGERTGMGWTPTLEWTPLPSSVPAAPPPAGAWMCPLSPSDLYTLAYGGYQAWRAGRMLRGGLRLVPGSAYPGQIIVYGSREAREAAGLSPFLTHARWTHPGLVRYLSPGAAFSRELLSGSTGVGVALSVGWDVYEYGWGSKREVGLGSTEFAAAVTVDVGTTALIPALGAAAGGLICGPGAPACVIIGAAAGNLLIVGFSASGLRERSVEAVSGFYEAILQPPPSAPESWEEIWPDWPNIPAP
ncbi:MAG: RHS repeat domain-containing protein [Anaerolineae bacterium]